MAPSLHVRLNGAAPPVAPAAAAALSPAFTPEVRRWEQSIFRWSTESSLPPALIATVMQIESCGDPRARSHAGAQGLFQVMPFHFQTGEDAGDPDTNALRGLAYLARALELSQGRVDLALAGYNGGLSRISQAPSSWPAETQRYVAWGSAIYAEITEGFPASPALRAWLEAGGARLCRAAAQAP
jgi:soluble lytic murein transglycosylase-like protein